MQSVRFAHHVTYTVFLCEVKKILCWGGSTIKSDAHWRSNLSSPSHFLFLLPLLFSFFASSVCLATWTNCLLSDLPKFYPFIHAKASSIQALSDIMPEPIKRGGGKECTLSSSFISHLFLVQFQVSLSQTTHAATLILFRHGTWWLLQYVITNQL